MKKKSARRRGFERMTTSKLAEATASYAAVIERGLKAMLAAEGRL